MFSKVVLYQIPTIEIAALLGAIVVNIAPNTNAAMVAPFHTRLVERVDAQELATHRAACT